MRVAIVYNQMEERADLSERDVLVQRDDVLAGLRRLGHNVVCVACSLNLEQLRQDLTASRPEVVFNLVESLGGTDRLMPLAPLLYEALGIPFTGADSRAIMTTSDKRWAKQQMLEHGLPTPAAYFLGEADRLVGSADGVGIDPRGSMLETPGGDRDQPLADAVIIKAIYEHASFGMDDEAILWRPSAPELRERLLGRQRLSSEPHFAERYIDGREFNLTLLDGPHGPRVLPAAEIDFSAFAAEKPRIVGYRAKWEETSYEYQHTPRRFVRAADEADLLSRLEELADKCWDVFRLKGYARVDMRVDLFGQPWVLEVNANPCLSPDAGFAAAVAQAGISYDEALAAILEATTAR